MRLSYLFQSTSAVPSVLPRMCVYQIRHRRSSRVYVGSSGNFSRRIERHLEELRTGRHKNYRLQQDFDAYGEPSFVFEVLEIVEYRARLEEREQHYIDTLKPFYNIAQFAGFHPRFGRLPEQKKPPIARGIDGDIPAVRIAIALGAVALGALAARRGKR